MTANYETTLAAVRGISEGTRPTGRRLLTVPVREFRAGACPADRLPDRLANLVTPRGTGVMFVARPLNDSEITAIVQDRKS
jgi:hypothetical protein